MLTFLFSPWGALCRKRSRKKSGRLILFLIFLFSKKKDHVANAAAAPKKQKSNGKNTFIILCVDIKTKREYNQHEHKQKAPDLSGIY